MIVDAHVHLNDDRWRPAAFKRGLGRIISASLAKYSGEFADPDELVKGADEQFTDPTGELCIADMDGAGVDVSVITTVDYAMGDDEPCSGEPYCMPIAEVNDIFGDIAQKHPDRFVHLVAVDPRRKDAAAELERGVTERGARGLKLHPTTGFYPDDPVCYPLYEKARELDVPVLFHTGTQPAPMKAKYARPIFVDSAAADFPEVKMVMAHVGHCWWEEALVLAGTKWNLYVDISGWQREYLYHPNNFYRMLRSALDEIGPYRVMYGTDNPYLQLVLSSQKWVAAVQGAVECKEYSFSEEEIDVVMGVAAQKLYKIKSEG
jgi:predicted TIM-barrel fold metal-dependent hydrolase